MRMGLIGMAALAAGLPDGTCFVKPETAHVRTATRVAGRKWIVELGIPFRELGLSGGPAGTVWRGNFVRHRAGAGLEDSAWNRVEERLADPRAFGELRFLAE